MQNFFMHDTAHTTCVSNDSILFHFYLLSSRHWAFYWAYRIMLQGRLFPIKNPQGTRKINAFRVFLGIFNLLPAMGLEPIRGCPQQILSLPRLPFRHAGIYSFSEQMIYYHTPKKFATKKSKKSQKPIPSISQLQLQKLPKIVAGFLPMLYNKYTPISELCSLEWIFRNGIKYIHFDFVILGDYYEESSNRCRWLEKIY